MTNFLIAGNHYNNLVWAEKLTNLLLPSIGTTKIFKYKHWGQLNDDAKIEYAFERARLQSFLENRSNRTKITGIIAKSVGSLLVIEQLNNGILAGLPVILIGIPFLLNWPEVPPATEMITHLPSEHILVIQEEHDPLGPKSFSEPLLSAKAINTKFIPGDTHNYASLSTIASLINPFFQATN